MSKVKLTTTAKAAAAVTKETKPKSFDGEVNSGVKLLAAIIAMGADYNPFNTKITAPMINLKQTEITTKNNASKDAVNSEKQLLIDRNLGFKMINVIATGSLKVLKSSENVQGPQIVVASHMVTHIRGGRINPIKILLPAENIPTVVDETTVDKDLTTDSGNPELNAIRRKSVSFQKMGIKLGSLFTLISYYKSLPCYQTNEAALTIEALFAFYQNLVDLNNAAENAIATTNSTRDARNESFFNNTTGARFLYTQVKNYIASKPEGTKSAYYKLVKGLPFPNLIEKKLRTATTNY